MALAALSHWLCFFGKLSNEGTEVFSIPRWWNEKVEIIFFNFGRCKTQS